MRKRWLFLLLAVFTAMFAAEPAKEKVEIFATKVDSNETIVHAYGDVLVLHQDQYLSANEAIYNRQKGELELIGNITVMQGADYYAIGEYAKYNLKEKDRMITPFYMTDKKSKVWLSCEEAHGRDKDFDLQSGMVSGCNPHDPLWEIYFSSSDYNSETKWMNLYNARLHIYKIPVFYMPYFGYSLDTKRRSGLLIPSFGYSSSEGMFYEQPIYIAEYDSWDLELRPQIRTDRGQGIYATLRFVDSAVSKGSITTGYFKEQSQYVEENKLANDQHHGFNIDYENYAFLQSWFGLNLEGQSGFYADINWMNDVDYINLSQRADADTEYATSSQIFSRVNVFYNEEKNYVGAYFKYYRDLEQENNDETLQSLPIVQYHRYLETFLDQHLLSNINVNFNNLYRPEGKTASKTSVDIPIIVQTSLFDDHIDLSYRADLHGRHISFGGDEDDNNINTDYDSGKYYRSTHTFGVGTHLMKGYEKFAHAMAFNVAYIDKGSEHRDGFYDDIEAICDANPDNDLCGYYTLNEIRDETKLQFVEYLFNNTGRQVLYHRLAQSIDHDDNDKLSELENELDWLVTPEISLYSDTFYEHDGGYVSKQISSLRYNDETIMVGLSHFFEDKRRRYQIEDSSYLTSRVSYRYDRHYRYFANYSYDLETDQKKRTEIGFMYTKRCWDFGIRYVENNRPILQRGNTVNSIYDKYVYVTVMLKPVGGSEFGYEFNNDE